MSFLMVVTLLACDVGETKNVEDAATDGASTGIASAPGESTSGLSTSSVDEGSTRSGELELAVEVAQAWAASDCFSSCDGSHVEERIILALRAPEAITVHVMLHDYGVGVIPDLRPRGGPEATVSVEPGTETPVSFTIERETTGCDEPLAARPFAALVAIDGALVTVKGELSSTTNYNACYGE